MNYTLLEEAFHELQDIFPGTRHHSWLQDEFGKYGCVVLVDGFPYVLCAKASMSGDIVSVHEALVETAKALNAEKCKIVMFLRQSEKSKNLYVFTTADIDKNKKGFKNERNGVQMVNFSVRLGINLKKLVEKKKEQAPAQPTPEAAAQAEREKIIEQGFGAVKVPDGGEPGSTDLTCAIL